MTVFRLVGFVLFSPALCVATDEPDPASLSGIVDRHIAEKVLQAGVTPAPTLADAMWLRRVTLDLAGRIPSVAELRDFEHDPRPGKRQYAVDKLLSSPDYAYHQRNVLDNMLQSGYGEDRQWRAWLLRSVRDGRSWHELFRTMMIGRDENPDEQPALTFLKKRANNLDEMTNDVSRLFFGVSINCAQCHDHPLVGDWQQDHYFGFKSFFARTYLTKSRVLAEKPPVKVKFTTTEGEEKQARLMFLSGTVVEEPEDKRTDEQRKKDDEEVRRQMREDKVPPPKPPAFSPRRKLVDTALSGENRDLFAKSIVNRVWARFFARGLVHPLDQLHSENPASHPELLDWLTAEFIAHNYNLRWLHRGLVLSETYARSSAWPSADEPPPAELFAVAQARPLAPRQYSLSLILATASPDEVAAWQSPDMWPTKRRELEDRSQGYTNLFELPGEYFNVAVDEALLFANSDRIRNDFLRDGNDRLTGYLKKQGDSQQTVRTAFLAVLSREPDAAELQTFNEFLQSRADRPAEGIRDLLWALITSPELRFNH